MVANCEVVQMEGEKHEEARSMLVTETDAEPTLVQISSRSDVREAGYDILGWAFEFAHAYYVKVMNTRLNILGSYVAMLLLVSAVDALIYLASNETRDAFVYQRVKLSLSFGCSSIGRR
jgi:hypothetical protein